MISYLPALFSVPFPFLHNCFTHHLYPTSAKLPVKIFQQGPDYYTVLGFSFRRFSIRPSTFSIKKLFPLFCQTWRDLQNSQGTELLQSMNFNIFSVREMPKFIISFTRLLFGDCYFLSQITKETSMEKFR